MAVLVEEGGVEGVVVEQKEMHGRRCLRGNAGPYIPITHLCNSITYDIFRVSSTSPPEL